MSVRFAFQSVPPRLAIISCAIYVAVAVLLPRALIFVSLRSGGSTMLLLSPGDGRSSMRSSLSERLVWHGNS